MLFRIVHQLYPLRIVNALPSIRSIHIDASSMKGKHFDSFHSFTSAELNSLIAISSALKTHLKKDPASYRPLIGRSMAMIFQKRSTRTRVSAESGFAQLGGHALFLANDDIQLGENESLKDTSLVLSRFSDIILARVFEHRVIEELSMNSTVPVINALSDMHHPLQGLADIMTLKEHFGRVEGLTIAWVGDGNNILHTFVSGAGKFGYNVRYATPKGYEPSSVEVALAEASCRKEGRGSIFGTNDPSDAIKGADVIVTDTWVSMGQETEKKQRLAAFEGYQLTFDLIDKSKPNNNWVFLHCLPRKENEVDDDVFYSDKSLVWDEAENRKWTVMAVALAQINGDVRLQ